MLWYVCLAAVKEQFHDIKEIALRKHNSLILNVLDYSGKKGQNLPYRDALCNIQEGSRSLCPWACVSFKVKLILQCLDKSVAGHASAIPPSLSFYTAVHNRKWGELWFSLNSFSLCFKPLNHSYSRHPLKPL